MWRLCFSLFVPHLSFSGALGLGGGREGGRRLCVVIVAFPGYLHLLFYQKYPMSL